MSLFSPQILWKPVVLERIQILKSNIFSNALLCCLEVGILFTNETSFVLENLATYALFYTL